MKVKQASTIVTLDRNKLNHLKISHYISAVITGKLHTPPL